MLYLKLPSAAADHGASRRVPLADQLVPRLERILLCNDRAERYRELVGALSNDHDFAGWAIRCAELRLCRTINRIDQAANWLCGCLEEELGSTLVHEPADSQTDFDEACFAALVAKLCDYERRLSEFHERLEQEKLKSLKELAYGASHEINNPLANIAARAQLLLADERDPERSRKLTAIHRQAMRAHEMIADLMLFARPPKLRLTQCELRPMVGSVVDSLRDLASEYNVELIIGSSSDSIWVWADSTQFGVALQALIVNGLEAVGDGGHVWIEVRRSGSGSGALAEVAVRDDGPGISEDVRRHLFDPFYSGREAGRGLGFGLSKCWRIVTDHGGRVVVQQPASGGAEIDLLLPYAPAAAMRA